MKRIIIVLAVLALSGQGIQGQTSAQFSSLNTSLNAVAGGAGTVGTVFTAPPGSDAALVTWTTSYSAPPASITMLLQASLDNSTWFTLDTSTAVGGELRNIETAARFFRCNISAVSGAVNKTCSFVLKRSNAATSSLGTTFAGNISGDRFLAGNGTQALPSFAFTAEPDLGFYRPGAGFMYFPPTNGLGVGGYGVGPSIFMGSGVLGIEASSNAGLRWSSTTSEQGLVDTGISRSAAGVVAAGTGAIGATNGTVAMTNLLFSSTVFASLGTPANGSVAYCSDCVIAATCAGAGTGAIAKRLNGVWVCN